MKKIPLLLAALALTISSTLADEGTVKASDYNFEFKVAKQSDGDVKKDKKKRGDREQERPGPQMDEEQLSYKVQVENKSLADVSDLEVRYTVYLSPTKQRGGSRKSAKGSNAKAREVTGETRIEKIARGNRSTFETVSVTITKAGKQGGGPPGGGGGGGGRPGGGGGEGGPPEGGGEGGPGNGPGGPRGPEKLDGIKVELFMGETKVGEHVYGNAAKRAAKAERDEEEENKRKKK